MCRVQNKDNSNNDGFVRTDIIEVIWIPLVTRAAAKDNGSFWPNPPPGFAIIPGLIHCNGE